MYTVYGVNRHLVPSLDVHGVNCHLVPSLDVHGVECYLVPSLDVHGINRYLVPSLDVHGVNHYLVPSLDVHGVNHYLVPSLDIHGLHHDLVPSLDIPWCIIIHTSCRVLPESRLQLALIVLIKSSQENNFLPAQGTLLVLPIQKYYRHLSTTDRILIFLTHYVF